MLYLSKGTIIGYSLGQMQYPLSGEGAAAKYNRHPDLQKNTPF